MASNPDIFLQGLIGTTGLRPIQEIQAGQLGLAQQRLGTQQQQQQLDMGQLAIGQAQRDAEEEQAFQREASIFAQNPTPRGMLSIAVNHPKHYQAAKAGFDAMNEDTRMSHLAEYSAIEAALSNGRFDLAAKRMRDLQAAERSAGLPSESNGASQWDDEISAIERGDKSAVNTARATVLGHIAALTGTDKFASTYGVVAKANEPRVAGPGAQLLSPTGEVIARVPFKPQAVKLRPGEEVYEYAPSADEGDADGAQPDGAGGGGDLISHMIPITMNVGEGTGGRDRTAAGGLITSPKGAQGRMQVMPGTNTDPGFGVTPAADASDEERARVGRDYLSAMMRRYDDPAKAWAAYNAGPGAVDDAVAAMGPRWLHALRPETRSYVARNMSALQRQVRAGGGTMRKLADGPPVQQYRMLTPPEIEQRKLDPAVPWQISPQGRVTAVTHPTGAAHAGGAREPRTPDNVYAPILAKIAQGIPLTPDEANALAYYRRRRPGAAVGVQPSASGTPAYKEGTIATGPGGKKLIRKGGHWVPYP